MMILYKELQYKIIKNNPRITEEDELDEKLKKATTIKRKITIQTLIFSFLGLSLASPIFIGEDELVISSILVTLALVPFIFAIYQTTIQTSYINSLDIFKPLESLPLKIGSFQLSALLSIDFIPMLGIVLPTGLYLLIYYPSVGILAFTWFITGILFGHTVGLLIYSGFGARVESGGKTIRFAKNILKILGFLAFMGMFFMINYLQDYFIAQGDIFMRYSVVYPFSIASVFETLDSVITLSAHLLLLIPLYMYSSRKVWKNIIETESLSTREVETDYAIKTEKQSIALVKKDLKIIFRKSTMIAGLFIPLYVLLPQVLLAIQRGSLPVHQTTLFLFMVGVLTVATSDAILKVEGKAIQSLRNLPLTTEDFIFSKALSMSTVTILASLGFIMLGTYFDLVNLILIPYAFLLPLNASLFSMHYLFRHSGNNIGIPDINFYKLLPLLILTGLVFMIIGIPVLLFEGAVGFIVSYGLASVMLFLFYRKMK